MYAKLVTKAGSNTFIYSNATTNAIANVAVYFNTLIDVITGNITNVNSVNNTIFDTSLCEIISTVSPGWSIYDNTASNSVFVSTPAAPPLILRAPYTDNASAYKYLWCAVPTNTVQTNSYGGPFIRWIPMEDWNPSTNVATNALFPISNVANASGIGQFSYWYDAPGILSTGQPISSYPDTIGKAGTTTIISASQSHLYVWTFADQFGTNGANFTGNFLLSEYSRDDAWNTPENGFPSWGMWGSRGAGRAAGTEDGGTVIRVLNPNTGSNSTHVAPYTSVGWTTYNYTLRSRISAGPIYNSPAGVADMMSVNAAPGSFGRMGQAVGYIPSYSNGRNSSNNVGFILSDIRIVPTNGITDTAGAPTTFYGVGPIAYGSITTVSPYVYLFRAQYPNLTEFVIDGVGYINLYTSNNSVVTNGVFATSIVVKKV